MGHTPESAATDVWGQRLDDRPTTASRADARNWARVAPSRSRVWGLQPLVELPGRMRLARVRSFWDGGFA